jgi:rhodanese-related sulfurtransferase
LIKIELKANQSGESQMPNNKQGKSAKQTIPTWIWIGIGIVAVVIIGLIVFGGTGASPQSLPAEVSVSEAAQLQTEGAFILDVREPDEWTQGHIAGATLIPLGELPNRLSELPEGEKIVVVCRSGNRSAQGRDILLNSGFTQVTSMAGGMNAWQSQGYPISTE